MICANGSGEMINGDFMADRCSVCSVITLEDSKVQSGKTTQSIEQPLFPT